MSLHSRAARTGRQRLDDRVATTAAPSRPPQGRADRRIAERRRAVISERVRRRRHMVRSVLLTCLLVAALYVLARTPLFGLAGVKVEGAHRVAASEVVRAAGVRLGQPVLGMDLESVAQRVERLPYVADATVRSRFPSAIVIAVSERRPAAVIEVDGARWLASGDGTVLGPAGTGGRLPVVQGIPLKGAVVPGKRVPPGPLQNALAAIAGMRPDLLRQVTAVRATSVDGLTFTLSGRTRLLYGAAEEQAAKDQAALFLLGQAKRQGGVAARIDVRAPSNPSLLPG